MLPIPFYVLGKKKRQDFSMASWPERIAGCWALVEKCSVEKCKWEHNLSEKLDPTGGYQHLKIWPTLLLKYLGFKWAKSEVTFQKPPAFILSLFPGSTENTCGIDVKYSTQTRKKKRHISFNWMLRFPLDTVLITDSLGNSTFICIVFPC